MTALLKINTLHETVWEPFEFSNRSRTCRMVNSIPLLSSGNTYGSSHSHDNQKRNIMGKILFFSVPGTVARDMLRIPCAGVYGLQKRLLHSRRANIFVETGSHRSGNFVLGFRSTRHRSRYQSDVFGVRRKISQHYSQL